MHNRLVRWLRGDAPQCVGTYCGDLGVCFVYKNPTGHRLYLYQPSTAEGGDFPLAAAIEKFCARVDASGVRFALAVAMRADDVFVRSMSVPTGLSDAQLEQLAIVEAVANLPVPPEEICLDFMRLAGSADTPEETLRLAFCRRERVDEILAVTEAFPLSVGVIDRDVQAIHDAVLAVVATSGQADSVTYPFGLLLTEITPRLVIYLDALTCESYPIRLSASEPEAMQSDLRQQISHCWTRCRMAQGQAAPSLGSLICIGEGLPTESAWLSGLSIEEGMGVVRLDLSKVRDGVQEGVMPPDEIWLIASGMATRSCQC